jgi:hypothetical protein
MNQPFLDFLCFQWLEADFVSLRWREASVDWLQGRRTWGLLPPNRNISSDCANRKGFVEKSKGSIAAAIDRNEIWARITRRPWSMAAPGCSGHRRANRTWGPRRARERRPRRSSAMEETMMISEYARQLMDAHGPRAIAEAAQRAVESERMKDKDESQTWRQVEAALKGMQGPLAS